MSTVDLTGIGARFVEERERLGFASASAIAKALSASQPGVHKVESGASTPGGDLLARSAALGMDVHYVLTGVRRIGEIDATLFGACEAALRAGYRELRPDTPESIAFRSNQLCKLYNTVVAGLRPDEDASFAAMAAVAALLMWADDPTDSTQLGRVLLHPATPKPTTDGNSIFGAPSTTITHRNVTASGTGTIAAGKGVHHHYAEPPKRPKK